MSLEGVPPSRTLMTRRAFAVGDLVWKWMGQPDPTARAQRGGEAS